jgi:hypothetical protein
MREISVLNTNTDLKFQPWLTEYTECIQNQIEILKYLFSAASERLSDKIIFKDQSKME